MLTNLPSYWVVLFWVISLIALGGLMWVFGPRSR
jgi:hypothetical protein